MVVVGTSVGLTPRPTIPRPGMPAPALPSLPVFCGKGVAPDHAVGPDGPAGPAGPLCPDGAGAPAPGLATGLVGPAGLQGGL